MAIALINAFSQLGNVAGSYVWSLKDNGFRQSYGIVTAMFGVTILGCLWFRHVLNGLNKKLEEAWESQPEVATQAASGVEHLDSADEALRMTKGFRYLV